MVKITFTYLYNQFFFLCHLNQADNLKDIRPTRIVGVPRVWEKIKDKMVEAESKASPIKKALIRWAKSAALEHHQKYITGKIPYGIQYGSIKYKLAYKLVLR